MPTGFWFIYGVCCVLILGCKLDSKWSLICFWGWHTDIEFFFRLWSLLCFCGWHAKIDYVSRYGVCYVFRVGKQNQILFKIIEFVRFLGSGKKSIFSLIYRVCYVFWVGIVDTKIGLMKVALVRSVGVSDLGILFYHPSHIILHLIFVVLVQVFATSEDRIPMFLCYGKSLMTRCSPS